MISSVFEILTSTSCRVTSNKTISSPMMSGRNNRKSISRRLFRATALLFLLYTGVDLVFPQICSEEPVGAATKQSVPASSGINADFRLAVDVSKESRHEQNSEVPCRDEDCFCCCAHVMPSPLFVEPSVADSNLGNGINRNLSLISAPLNTPDHPPRFA